jgi:hypothetical protein
MYPLETQLLTDSAPHYLALLYASQIVLWTFKSFLEELFPFKVFLDQS